MSKKCQTTLNEYYQLIRDHKKLDINKMKDAAEELLRYSYQWNDTYGQAFAFIHLACYYIVCHKFDSARFNLAKAKKLCAQHVHRKLLVACYCYEGTICQLCGDKIKAIRTYGKAMDLAEKENEDTTIGVIYNNMATILMDYGDMELAKQYFEWAAEKFMRIPEEKQNLAQVYANLVQVNCALQDLTTARRYLDEMKAIDKENKKAASLAKASEARFYAEEHDVARLKQAYAEHMEILNHCKASEAFFTSDILLIAESLLLADLQEGCRTLLMRLEKLIESDLELELRFYKLYIRFQEKYAEESAKTYEKYYHLLMQSEAREYRSLAESLGGHIKLSEMNQKQSALEKENKTLQRQAHLDDMTGVFNRRYFDKLLLKINMDSNVQTIGCIMLDIDFFKEYNDTHGHLQGDQILKQVVSILTKHATEYIYVGRFGGDEFYCLCAGLGDAQIEKYLTDVYDDLRRQRIEHHKNPEHIVTVSAGFCNEAKDGIVLSQVLSYADRALYMAKNNGRNGFMKYTKA